jgi:hypothetical protein
MQLLFGVLSPVTQQYYESTATVYCRITVAYYWRHFRMECSDCQTVIMRFTTQCTSQYKYAVIRQKFEANNHQERVEQ